jgi:hypothetical protein
VVAVAVTDGWWKRLAAWARANVGVFHRHPWTLPLVTAARRMGPQECAWGECAPAGDRRRRPRARGLRPVLQLVNGYVRGAAVPVVNHAPDPAVIERSGRADEPPLILALLAAPPPGPGDTDAGFEFGLARSSTA